MHMNRQAHPVTPRQPRGRRIELTCVACVAGWAIACGAITPTRAAAQIAPDDQEPAAPMAVPAQLGVPDAQWLLDRVAELGSDALAVRDRAQLTLATTPGVPLDAIEELLDSADLSPEQRVRLGAIGLSLFVDSPRAAMGVSFGMRSFEARGVVVTATVPGFQAADVLLAGDIITMMDGVEITEFDGARQVILSFDPGDRTSVTVLRQGQPVEVELTFGSFMELAAPTPPSTEVLNAAWNLRRDRRSERPIDSVILALHPTQRGVHGDVDPRQVAEAWRRVAVWLGGALVNTDFFVIGPRRIGQPIPDTRRFGQPQDDGPAFAPIAGGAARRLDASAVEPFSNKPVTPEVARLLKNADDRIAMLRRQVRDAEQLLQNPAIPADQRARLSAQVRAFQNEIVRLREGRRQLLGQ